MMKRPRGHTIKAGDNDIYILCSVVVSTGPAVLLQLEKRRIGHILYYLGGYFGGLIHRNSVMPRILASIVQPQAPQKQENDYHLPTASGRTQNCKTTVRQELVFDRPRFVGTTWAG